MIDEKLQKAFLAGKSKLQMQEYCNELFPSATDSSIVDCYKAIKDELGVDAEFYALHITLDAFWAFVHKLNDAPSVDGGKEYLSYSGAHQLEPLSDALMQISLKEAAISLEAGYGDEIKDGGLVIIKPFDANCDVVDRSDITLRSLVDEVISGKMTSYNNGQESIFDDAIPDLIKLKKLFQDQVDYIDTKIEEAKKNPA